MFQQWLRNICIAMIATTVSSACAFGGSPAQQRLLRLVPANAEIVAGIEDPHHGDQSGRLLLVTHNDNVDLRDWLTLAGVDDRQEVDKLVQVAMSSSRGELSEHLLLVQGSFNGRRIFASAEKNGGIATSYEGVTVMIVKPFAREQQEMQDTRWLAIVDDSTAIFGTPDPVKRALERYASRSAADSQLVKKLMELKPDVNCWSILTMPGAMLASHLRTGVLDETGITLLRGVNSVAVGVHYGSKARVDFAFSAEDAPAAAVLATSMSAQPHLLPIADTLRTQFEGVSVHQNDVRGSLRVAEKEFGPWLDAVYARLSVDAGAPGDEVARAGVVR
jgi:hypothetical protein